MKKQMKMKTLEIKTKLKDFLTTFTIIKDNQEGEKVEPFYLKLLK